MSEENAVSDNAECQQILAEERTLLAKSRTVQSFIRTGLALIGMGIAVLKLFQQAAWSIVLGGVLIAIGISLVVYYAWWHKHYAERVEELEMKISDIIENENVTDHKHETIKDKIPVIKKEKNKKNE